MKTVFQRGARKRRRPLIGMLVALASICAFLVFLAALTIVVHFVVM